MRNHILRPARAFAAFAVAVSAVVAVAAPAQARATTASIDVARWQVGTTSAATVTWTNETSTVTSLMVRSPWPWGAAFANGTTEAATGADTSGTSQSILCPSANTRFTISNATLSGAPTCHYSNTSSWKGLWIDGGGLVVAVNATISVALPAGMVTAPSSARTDTWLVGAYEAGYDANTTQTAEIATTAYGEMVPFDWSKAMTPNGQIVLTVNDALTEATCKAPEYSIKPTSFAFTFSIFDGAESAARALGTTITRDAANGTATVTLPSGSRGSFIKCSLVAFAPAAISSGAIGKMIGEPFPPTAPRNVVATALHKAVRVTWEAPESANGVITNYLVQATPSGQLCMTRQIDADMFTCTFTGLVAGTSYTFRAQAVSGSRWSDRSAASNATSPYKLAITTYKRVKVLFWKQKITITGKAPGFAEGDAITLFAQIGNANWAKAGTAKVVKGQVSYTLTLNSKQTALPVAVRLEGRDATSNVTNVSVIK